MRMRKLAVGQSVVFFVSEEIETKVRLASQKKQLSLLPCLHQTFIVGYPGHMGGFEPLYGAVGHTRDNIRKTKSDLGSS